MEFSFVNKIFIDKFITFYLNFCFLKLFSFEDFLSFYDKMEFLTFARKILDSSLDLCTVYLISTYHLECLQRFKNSIRKI